MEELLHFKVDPLFIIKTMLQIHVENVLENRLSEAEIYALYACIRDLTEEETEELGHEYGRINNLDSISLSGTIEQREAFYKILIETDRYKTLLFENQCQGHAGLGVADTLTKKFYPCAFAGHWQTLIGIVKSSYLDIYSSDTAELDAFILQNFVFVGGKEKPDFYLQEDRSHARTLYLTVSKEKDMQMMIDSLEKVEYATREELEHEQFPEIRAMYYQMRSEID
ncbi:hypothetical protein [Listeria booriae]|uniref:hypothetical protein n=1 Tax=Listeria booriae TaxID=1552123 RepID=UPI00162385C4|nr:hypothetical protein [Listeria booriae]MBC2190509.1 hypothetical protein [Listeria booriae]